MEDDGGLEKKLKHSETTSPNDIGTEPSLDISEITEQGRHLHSQQLEQIIGDAAKTFHELWGYLPTPRQVHGKLAKFSKFCYNELIETVDTYKLIFGNPKTSVKTVGEVIMNTITLIPNAARYLIKNPDSYDSNKRAIHALIFANALGVYSGGKVTEYFSKLHLLGNLDENRVAQAAVGFAVCEIIAFGSFLLSYPLSTALTNLRRSKCAEHPTETEYKREYDPTTNGGIAKSAMRGGFTSLFAEIPATAGLMYIGMGSSAAVWYGTALGSTLLITGAIEGIRRCNYNNHKK